MGQVSGITRLLFLPRTMGICWGSGMWFKCLFWKILTCSPDYMSADSNGCIIQRFRWWTYYRLWMNLHVTGWRETTRLRLKDVAAAPSVPLERADEVFGEYFSEGTTEPIYMIRGRKN